jgi:hypothetical protein
VASLVLAAKAEVALAVLLVVRHRTPRLTGLLVLAIMTSVLIARSRDGATGSAVWITLVVSGSLAAVSGSRLLAPRPNLAAAYRVASDWWLVPTARLVGVLIVLLPILVSVALLMGAPSMTTRELVRLGAAAAGYAASWAALVMALTPAMGASGAAATGFLLAWFGAVPPSGVAAAVERWPLVQGPLVLMWNTLPLGWRASQWLEHGNVSDLALLVVWFPLSLAMAAWTMTVCYRLQHPRPGSSL